MSELPDFKKIEFPDMPPIPLEDVVPDASPEVSETGFTHILSNISTAALVSFLVVFYIIIIISDLTCA